MSSLSQENASWSWMGVMVAVEETPVGPGTVAILTRGLWWFYSPTF